MCIWPADDTQKKGWDSHTHTHSHIDRLVRWLYIVCAHCAQTQEHRHQVQKNQKKRCATKERAKQQQMHVLYVYIYGKAKQIREKHITTHSKNHRLQLQRARHICRRQLYNSLRGVLHFPSAIDMHTFYYKCVVRCSTSLCHGKKGTFRSVAWCDHANKTVCVLRIHVEVCRKAQVAIVYHI